MEIGLVALHPATSMLILTISCLKVLGPVLAQGPVSRLTVNNPIPDGFEVAINSELPNRCVRHDRQHIN